MPYKTFTDSSVLTASDVNTYLVNPGTLGYAAKTADQTGIAGAAVTSLSVTVTAVAGRRLRISALVNLAKDVSAGFVETRLYKDGTQAALTYTQHASSALGHACPVLIDTPTAGSHTYSVYVACSVGAVDVRAAATRPCFILVEDIGV